MPFYLLSNYYKIADENAKIGAETTINALYLAVKERINSAKYQMIGISKYSALNELKYISFISEYLKNKRIYLESILFSTELEVLIAFFDEYCNDIRDTVNYLSEIPKSIERLFFYTISMGKIGDSEENEYSKTVFSNNIKISFLRIYNEIMPDLIRFIFDNAEHMAQFCFNIGLFRKQVPEDSQETAIILSKVLDSGIIKRIVMRNENLEEIISIGYEDFYKYLSQDIKSLKKGGFFESAGIVFSNSGRPYWQISVPVGNLYLTGLVEINDILLNEDFNKIKICLCDRYENYIGQYDDSFKEKRKKIINSSSVYSFVDKKHESLISCLGTKIGNYGFENDLYFFIEMSLFIYLNDCYYTCILGVSVLFIAGIIFFYGGLKQSSISVSES